MKTILKFLCAVNFVLLVAIISVSCNKDDDTDNHTTAFVNADLIGTWEGNAVKNGVTTHFYLTCNDTLGLSGTGINPSGSLSYNCKWDIISSGNVTGSGYEIFHWNNGWTTIAFASWYLQLNNNKSILTGYFDMPAIEFFDSVSISLTKQ